MTAGCQRNTLLATSVIALLQGSSLRDSSTADAVPASQLPQQLLMHSPTPLLLLPTGQQSLPPGTFPEGYLGA